MKKCPSPTGFFKIDNLFGELLTEYQKTIARDNLGISQDSNLYWGNIKGFIENQRDVKSFINKVSQEETKKQIAELLEISPEVIDLLKDLTEWIIQDESGVDNLIQAVSANKQNIETLQKSTVYCTQAQYDELIREGLISDTTEYNIYEEDETI